MNNFQCQKCGIVIQSQYSPSSSGCPEGGSHIWIKLGEVGDKVFQCKKCGTAVRSKWTPSSSGCPSGGSHSWTKLA